MSVLKEPDLLQIVIAIEDDALRAAVQRALSESARPGAATFRIRPAENAAEDDAPPDALLVEVGGDVSLNLFRDYRDRFGTLPLVSVCRPEDAELGEVTTQHGGDDVVFTNELGAAVLQRTLVHARERHRLVRQLVAAREREAQLATHDSVTGLANRSLLFTCIAPAITFAQRAGSGLALVCLDVLALGEINRRFGFKVGDRVLSLVAERMQDSIRTSDMAARLGGGEFVVLLRDVPRPGDAAKPLRKILAEIGRPLYVDGNKLTVETRAGVAQYPEDGTDAESLVMSAHRALHDAKASAVSIAYHTAVQPAQESA